MSKSPDNGHKLPTYIYIAGRGHSGSTLLTLLLARHPEIAAVGELSLLSLQIARDGNTRWLGQCSCGERPLDCPVWGKALREVEAAEGVNIAANPFGWRVSDVGMEEEHRAAAPFKVPLVWLRNRCWRLVRYLQYLLPNSLGKLFGFYTPQRAWARNRSTLATKLAAANDATGIVDASKDALDMLDMYFHAEVPVKIVLLTRDPRGNVWSMLKRLKKGQKREEQVVPAAREWSKVNSRIWWLSKRVDPKDCLHVRYEDICRRPEEVMNELFDFVGFDRCDVVGETKTEGLDSDQGHTIGGNKIRFTGEKLKIREDTAWQGNLTSEELETIRNMTGGLSAKFGYEQ